MRSLITVYVDYHEAATSVVPRGLFTRLSLLSGALKRELTHTGEPEDRAAAQALFENVQTILASQPNFRRRRGDQLCLLDAGLLEEINLARLDYQQQFGSLAIDSVEDEVDDHFATNRDLVAHQISHAGNVFSSDLGVSDESQLSTEQLMNRLGLKEKTSLPFMNLQRNIKPYLVWTAGLPASKIQQMITKGRAPSYKPLGLRWHQLAGIVSAVRMLSFPKRGGILIADDTGIGKTSQTFGLLAMMMHRAEHHILTNGSYAGPLCGLPICSGPHIIVAPSSLIDNWRAEGMMWLNVTVEFFVYEGSIDVRSRLLAPASRFDVSVTKLHQRIILVSSSVSLCCKVLRIC